MLISTKVAGFKKQNNAIICNFLCKYIVSPVCFMAAVCKITFSPQVKMEEVT